MQGTKTTNEGIMPNHEKKGGVAFIVLLKNLENAPTSVTVDWRLKEGLL